MTAPTRRERLRTATVAEIKQGARHLLVDGGTGAVSLRAIARDMGMTAPAIYRYFPSLEALVVELAGDLYDELRGTVEAARDTAGDDPVDRLLAMLRAFRRWSVEHPAEFGLILGRPVPGMIEFMRQCDIDQPGARLGAVFLEPLCLLADRGRLPDPAAPALERRLGDRLSPLFQRVHGALPPGVAYAFLACWTRLYGLIATEVFHHLDWALTEPEKLFEIELTGLAGQLRGAPVRRDGSPPPPGSH